MEILARAIRKIKSKLRSGADLFLLSEIEFIQGKTYKTLTDAILVDKFKSLRKNSKKLEIAYKITDALDSLLGKEEKDEKIWKLLIETINKLNNCSLFTIHPVRDYKREKNGQRKQISNGVHCSLIYYFFLWKLFLILGYSPQLYSCPICQRKLIPETFWFSAEEGGIVCWRCFKDFKEEKKKMARETEVDTIKILRIFLTPLDNKHLTGREENWEVLEKLKMEEKTQRDLKEVSEFYLDFLVSEFSKMEK